MVRTTISGFGVLVEDSDYFRFQTVVLGLGLLV